ncbi:MAG: hypothetical protein JNK09_22825 [Prolixibacteraceae bacterium]|nr:hypothetical protein [Prolixibacteraceae bacterium]
MTKKIEKKPVFEILFKSEICFAVCVATSKFINWEVAAFAKDYFIIINKCDEERVKELTFYPTEGYKQVCQRSLSEYEIRIFKENRDKFVRVLHNEHGRVYEMKGWSFKAVSDQISQKLRSKIVSNK